MADDFYSQIDLAKLRKTIEYVNAMGNGTKAFYSQPVTKPYEIEVFVDVSLRRGMWKFAAHKYGAAYFPEFSFALVLAANDIVDSISAKQLRAAEVMGRVNPPNNRAQPDRESVANKTNHTSPAA